MCVCMCMYVCVYVCTYTSGMSSTCTYMIDTCKLPVNPNTPTEERERKQLTNGLQDNVVPLVT